jgi:hypothetical protein
MGFGSSRHAYSYANCNAGGKQYSNVHTNCDSNRYGYTYSYSHTYTNSNGYSHAHSYSHGYCNGYVYANSHSNCYCDSYRDGYCYRNSHTNGHGDPHRNACAYAHAFAKRYGRTKAAGDSPASAVTGDDELVECVVLRKGAWPRKSTSCHRMPVAFYAAWLPRSFTLNAVVRQFTQTPSQPDICAFGGKFTSSSEKPIHLRLIVAPRRFRRIFFAFAVSP